MKKPLPTQNEFMKLLTSLGGYNRRTTRPGPQTLWIGIRRMLDYSRAWQTFESDRSG